MSVYMATEKLLYTLFCDIYTKGDGLNKEEHLRKGKAIEKSIDKLDPEEDWQLIIEGVFGASIHYIAVVCEQRLGKYQETHKGLPRFLDENGLPEVATLFRELGMLRIGRWYGKKTNGKTAKLALEILKKIKSGIE